MSRPTHHAPRRTSRVTAALAGAAVLVAGLLSTSVVAPQADAARTFGKTPLEEVLSAADKHRRCGLSRDRLAALMLAPTFPETGSPSDQSPSPMTMSRWDNQSSLYSFGNTSTYQKAFWHPGIGPWQWDDASLQGLAAHQRIDTRFAADFTARYMTTRFCTNSSFSYVWAPWHACSNGSCLTIYNQIFQGGKLVNVASDLSVGRFGGMRSRTCQLGSGTPFTCWHVDPARAQGYKGFTVAGFGPSPVTAPYYSFIRDGVEHRHWLRKDTGYGIDIRASLPLGKDSRWGSLNWATGSTLSEIDDNPSVIADPSPPPGFSFSYRNVLGNYIPVVGDFNGSGRTDILWYGPGPAHDVLWYANESGGFTTRQVNVDGYYVPIVADFDGDGRDDVLWYGPGPLPDRLWYGRNTGFKSVAINVSGHYIPLAGDFDGDGRADVLWYGPGPNPDSIWYGRNSGFSIGTINVAGVYEPFVGDFNGNGRSDVFWYGPGPAKDVIWLGRGDGGFNTKLTNVNGHYTPLPGDFNGNGLTDILWYGPGTDYDTFWWATGDAGFASGAVDVNGPFQPFVGDFDGNGRDDIFWYRAGPEAGGIWFAD
jgi:hypothetical protein